MRIKTQKIRKLYFEHRSEAAQCVAQDLANPRVNRVWFTEQTWMKPDSDERFEVIEESEETTTDTNASRDIYHVS